MKMVKKILLGLVVLATAFAFTGCLKDDTEGAITGSGKKYSVKYTNDGTDAYRAYKATALKHAGALVKVTFKTTDVASSKMGIIFDLKDAASGVKDAKDFYVIGIGMEGGGNYYVSKFTDITDIQAKNFGASTTAKDKEPKEVEYVEYTSAGNLKLPAAAEDKSISLYVDYKLLINGTISYALYDITDEVAKTYKEGVFVTTEQPTPIKAGIIPDAFEAVTDATKLPQNKIAFYAQIAPGKTLEGSWNVAGTYLEAEDAE